MEKRVSCVYRVQRFWYDKNSEAPSRIVRRNRNRVLFSHYKSDSRFTRVAQSSTSRFQFFRVQTRLTAIIRFAETSRIRYK